MPKPVCPNCGFEPHPDEGPNCTRCNTPLVSDDERRSGQGILAGPGSLGGYSEEHEPERHTTLGGDDHLGSQTTAQLIEQQGLEQANRHSADKSPNDSTSAMPEVRQQGAKPESGKESKETVKKLSEKEIREIEQNLYGSGKSANAGKYVSEDEKLALLKGLPSSRKKTLSDGSAVPDGKAVPSDGKAAPSDGKAAPSDGPVVPAASQVYAPDSSNPAHPIHAETRGFKPRIAEHVTGTAYFVKDFIHLPGEQELHEGDSLVIQQRKYSLKRMRLSTNHLLAIGGIVGAILLLILGLNLAPGPDGNNGSVVGITVDQNGKPNYKKLTVRFPDLDKETTTGLDGFFSITGLPSGSHSVEFLENDRLLGQDFAAVASGEITTIVLTPTARSSKSRKQSGTTKSPPAETRVVADKEPPPQRPQAKKPRPSSKTATKKTKVASAPKPASIVLASSVDGARLKLDGQVLGAGNLRYRNLKPGVHTYEVSLSGYQTKSGRVELRSGKSTRLEVKLQPLQTKQQKAALEAKRLIATARTAIDRQDFEGATSALSDAIELEPSNASAYLLRAEAFSGHGQEANAYNDYIRAAEILRFQNKFSSANTAYGKAVELDDRTALAYVGRGNLHLARKQEIAAVTDFETALRLDKRNAGAYLGLGAARYRLGNYKKAVKHFKDARSLEPANPAAHRGLMLSYFKRSKIKDVRKSYERFVNDVSKAEVTRLRADPQFAPIIRIVDSGK